MQRGGQQRLLKAPSPKSTLVSISPPRSHCLAIQSQQAGLEFSTEMGSDRLAGAPTPVMCSRSRLCGLAPRRRELVTGRRLNQIAAAPI